MAVRYSNNGNADVSQRERDTGCTLRVTCNVRRYMFHASGAAVPMDRFSQFQIAEYIGQNKDKGENSRLVHIGCSVFPKPNKSVISDT